MRRVQACTCRVPAGALPPPQGSVGAANDGGSRWWQDATGAVSRAGMLTFLSTPEGPNEFRIL